MKKDDTLLTFFELNDRELHELSEESARSDELSAIKEELRQLREDLKTEKEEHDKTRLMLQKNEKAYKTLADQSSRNSDSNLSETKHELSQIKKDISNFADSIVELSDDVRSLQQSSDEYASDYSVSKLKERIEKLEAELKDCKTELQDCKKVKKFSKTEEQSNFRENSICTITLFLLSAGFIGLDYLRTVWTDGLSLCSGFMCVYPIIGFIIAGFVFGNNVPNGKVIGFGILLYVATEIGALVKLLFFPLAYYSGREACCGITFNILFFSLTIIVSSLCEEFTNIDIDILIEIFGIILSVVLFVTANLTATELLLGKWFLLIGFICSALYGAIAICFKFEYKTLGIINIALGVLFAIFDLVSYPILIDNAKMIIPG